jgi:hypothetical protein
MSCLTWLLHELGGRRDIQNRAWVRFSPALTSAGAGTPKSRSTTCHSVLRNVTIPRYNRVRVSVSLNIGSCVRCRRFSF